MKKIKEALQHARLFIVDRIGYSQSEVLERVAIGKEIDEALAAIEQSSQRIAQLETYISENLHKKAICGCGDSIEPDTGAVCGTCASIEQASQPQYITWQSPELAHEALSHLADATGAVDQLLVSLDTKSPSYDGGPEYRQAWYCVMTRQFICLATNTALRNVTGWVFAK